MNQVLFNLLKEYCEEYDDLREQHGELSNLDFHHKYGLYLKVPENWPLLDSLAACTANRFQSISIIYPTTTYFVSVREYFSSNKQDITFLSWHEIFTAMQMASSDVRYIKRVKAQLDSELVIALNPLSLPGIEDQVRGLVTGCLLILSR